MSTRVSLRRHDRKNEPARAPVVDLTSPRDGVRSPRLVWLMLFVVTTAAFAPVVGNGFLMWDDSQNVAKNPRMNPPTGPKFELFWQEPYLGLYIPATYTVWSGLAEIAWLPEPDSQGMCMTPWVFHAANVLVHLVSVSAVFLLLRKLITRPWPAAAGALLFAIHPLQVESVAWITGMKDVLAGCFSLLALWQYVCAADARPASVSAGWRVFHYFASVLLFALAVISKPSAITVPLSAMVVDLVVLGRPWKKMLEAVAPFLVLAIAFAWYQTEYVQVVDAPADGGRWWLRPLIGADSIVFYLGKLVYPRFLCFHYNHTPAAVISSGQIYYLWIFPAALFLLLIWRRRQMPILLASGALFVFGVLPVLGLVPFSYQRLSTVADRYAYAAMLGPAMALAGFMAWLNPARVGDGSRAGVGVRGYANAAVAVALAVLAMKTFAQTRVFRNDESFFTNGIKVNPRSADAWGGLAVTLALDKKFDAALSDARVAVDLDPNYVSAYVNLATVYDLMGHFDLAKKTFDEAAARDLIEKTEAARKISGEAAEHLLPNPDVETGLSGVFRELGQYADAEQHARNAIRAYFDFTPAHVNLASALYHQNQLKEAILETRLAVAMDPGNSRAQAYYARYMQSIGRRDEARKAAKIAMKIDPDDLEIQQICRELLH